MKGRNVSSKSNLLQNKFDYAAWEKRTKIRGKEKKWQQLDLHITLIVKVIMNHS